MVDHHVAVLDYCRTQLNNLFSTDFSTEIFRLFTIHYNF